MDRYAELQVTTNYSFLRGASHPRELVAAAQTLGMEAIAITDRNSLAGVVKAFDAVEQVNRKVREAREKSESIGNEIKLIVGCRLDLADGQSLLCYPRDRPAYSRLVRLLSLGKHRGGKGECRLTYDDLGNYGEGQIFVALGDEPTEDLQKFLQKLRADFRAQCYLSLTRRFRPNENQRLHALAKMARSLRLPTVATNDILYHVPERRMLQDVMTCIRLGKTIDTLGYEREQSADRFPKSPKEMTRLFSRHAEAIERTGEIAARCRFSLTELQYQYPDEELIPGLTAQQALEKITWEGAVTRYPDGIPEKARAQIEYELKIITGLKYAPYFLTVWRIVQAAREKEILCQGRGSAANSAVCFCLGVTEINPVITDVLFERFISADRGEPPDIDVDFEHQRREEVIQWIYEKYGRTHAALTATVIHYRSRRAVREVGKALGLTEDVTAVLAGSVWGWSSAGVSEARAKTLGLDPADRRLGLTLQVAREIIGFPRHLSQHPGGFVITKDRLDDLVPIENAAMKDRTVIEWDKDDIEVLKMMKVDVLGLGMLSCLRRAFALLKEHKGMDLTIASTPPDDPKVYAMICKADTIGVFQIESRAQMSMLPRLRPENYYDLVIEVSIVRPGPIQGGMVHPYLRRRKGIEKVSYPSPALEAVLKKTLGVPLFQEQAMKIAIVGAGFTPNEADQLRRAMATFRNDGKIHLFRERFISGMLKNGYEKAFAVRCFSQIEGFGTYGFPESHAASFAILVYVSSWVKCHHPDVFLCALLNSQPLGFYAPAQLVRDARDHGVTVLPVDINISRWDSALEPQTDGTFAVRLGLRLVKGMAEAAAGTIVAARCAPYKNLEDLWQRTELPLPYLEALAEADTCTSAGIDRRQALWTVRALHKPLPLFAIAHKSQAVWEPEMIEPDVRLTPLTAGENVLQDYATTSLSLRAHPTAFLRDSLKQARWDTLASVSQARDKQFVRIAGLVLVRQRPGSANGVVFVTLEDETGNANLVVWPDMFDRHRAIVMTSRLLACAGQVQTEGTVIHVVARELYDLTSWLRHIGDEAASPPLRMNSRDFH